MNFVLFLLCHLSFFFCLACATGRNEKKWQCSPVT
uniref:Uncharacterized protein n=1 Tax=Anguilla anguilla TaxID=7936 RepID=A0A0E9TSR1_ANGAN